GLMLCGAARGLFEELAVRGFVEWTVEYRQIAVDADKTLDLIAERPQVGRLDDPAVACPFVLLGEAEIEGLIADGHPVPAEEDSEQPVEIAADLREERRHVGGAERNPCSADDHAALFLDLLAVGGPGGLHPSIIGIGNVPLLGQLDERGCERHRLRRCVVEWPKGEAAALPGGDRGVEACPDHVDHLVLLEYRHAGEAYVGEQAALVGIDSVTDQELLDLAASHVGL